MLCETETPCGRFAINKKDDKEDDEKRDKISEATQK